MAEPNGFHLAPIQSNERRHVPDVMLSLVTGGRLARG